MGVAYKVFLPIFFDKSCPPKFTWMYLDKKVFVRSNEKVDMTMFELGFNGAL